MSSRGLCEYCRRDIGDWDETAGFICRGCLSARRARIQREQDRYIDEATIDFICW